jgi:hypothetical protein
MILRLVNAFTVAKKMLKVFHKYFAKYTSFLTDESDNFKLKTLTNIFNLKHKSSSESNLISYSNMHCRQKCDRSHTF